MPIVSKTGWVGSVIYFCHYPAANAYAPITVEGGLTPATCPLGGAFALYGEFLLHMHTLCSTDLMKETAPVERN